MRRLFCLAAAGLPISGCAEADRNAPSDAQVMAQVRSAFLAQTFSNHLFGANPEACADSFEVHPVSVNDRRIGETGGTKYVSVAVTLTVRARTDFPNQLSCAWGTRSNTGTQGYWRAGETRSLSRMVDFVKWESGWRLSL